MLIIWRIQKQIGVEGTKICSQLDDYSRGCHIQIASLVEGSKAFH